MMSYILYSIVISYKNSNYSICSYLFYLCPYKNLAKYGYEYIIFNQRQLCLELIAIL